MQSSKPSRKTHKIAEENVAPVSEKSTAPETKSKPRPPRSSTMKKDASDMGSAKHRRGGASESVAAAPKTNDSPILAPATGSEGGIAIAAETQKALASRIASHEEIAKLAHCYWAARGYAHGYSEQDWLRAEQELNAKR